MNQKNYGNFKVIDGLRNPEFLSEKLSEYSEKILEGVDNIDQIGNLSKEEHLQALIKVGDFYVDFCYFVTVYGKSFPELKTDFDNIRVKLFYLYSKLRNSLHGLKINFLLRRNTKSKNKLIEYLIGEKAINPHLEKGNLVSNIVELTKNKLLVIR